MSIYGYNRYNIDPDLMDQVKKLENEVANKSGGSSFKVCDMKMLERFIVLGSEQSTYYSTQAEVLMENVHCVQRLLKDNHYQEVLDLVEQFSKAGRVPKEDPILMVLGICASNSDMNIRRAAYKKVNSICNIPTKLFRFIEFTHNEITDQRKINPPEPQPRRAKRKHVSEELSKLEISEGEGKKEPTESVDEAEVPAKKKKVQSELKKVNKQPRKSLGWGRMRRNGIAEFYSDNEKEPCRLLYLLTKYKQRHDWSHKQVLTYSHPKMKGESREAKNLVLKYCTRGYDKVTKELAKGGMPGVSENLSEVVDYIKVLHEVSTLSPDKDGDEEKLLGYMQKYGFRPQAKPFTSAFTVGDGKTTENIEGKKSPIQIVREHIPTGFLNSVKVWEALLVDMPMTAMIRNLGKMSSLNMFSGAESTNTDIVLKALNNERRLQSARVHPIKILIAMEIYRKGQGEKGKLSWPVNQQIVDALNAAFYKSFRSPEIGKNFKTGKKYMLCLDVSGSMTSRGCVGCPQFSPAMASAAMAMVTWNIEDDVDVMGFGREFMDMTTILRKDMSISDAMSAIRTVNMGATDCSLPMSYAIQNKKEVDVFIVYTDSETNCNRISPMTALRLYNQDMDRKAKLIVCAMQSNAFSIADPNDNIALDVVGFDGSVPDIISKFANEDTSMKCNVCKDCKVAREKAQQES